MTDDNHSRQAENGVDENGQQLLGQALENTLANLNQSIERMEEIVRKFEAGESDLDESISLLSEANELAVASSKELDQAVQKVVYDSDEEQPSDDDVGRDESDSERDT